MPLLSHHLVRLAFVHLVLGFTLGGLLLIHEGMGWWPWIVRLRPLHIEWLLFGWMLQLVMGVASWILPLLPEKKHQPSRNLLASLILLNLGLWTAGLGPLFPALPSLTSLGRLAEIGAVLCFITHIWPRILVKKKEMTGER